jgi:hypothetical protein
MIDVAVIETDRGKTHGHRLWLFRLGCFRLGYFVFCVPTS